MAYPCVTCGVVHTGTDCSYSQPDTGGLRCTCNDSVTAGKPWCPVHDNYAGARFYRPPEPDADRYELKMYRVRGGADICYRTISGDKAEVLRALTKPEGE